MIHLKRADNGQFYGCVTSRNNRIIWQTPETYKRREGVHKAIAALYMVLVESTVTGGKFQIKDHTK